MTNTLVLSNGTELEYIQVNGAGMYHQGAQRDSLSFVLPRETNDLNDVDLLFSNKENTALIALRTAQGDHMYEDYTIKVSLRTEHVEIEAGDNTKPPVTEERIIVTMAQVTYMEKMLETILKGK